MEDDALDLLTRIAMEASMRYAIQMITTSSLVASKRKGSAVEIQDIKRVYGCLLYTSPSPRDATLSRMPSSA